MIGLLVLFLLVAMLAFLPNARRAGAGARALLRKVLGTVVATVLMCTVLVGCGAAIQTGRTLNDAANILCTLFAAEHQQELQGISPQDWCAIKHNLDPFVEESLAAQRQAGASLGIQADALPPQQ